MPQQRICDNDLPDGTRCKELATETNVQFVYRNEVVDGHWQQVLKEIHRTIYCPKCGHWVLHETVNGD